MPARAAGTFKSVSREVRWRARVGQWSLVVAFALLWPLALPYSEATRNANEVPRVMQAIALADAGSWSIDGLIERGMDPGPDLARVKGRTFPNKAPAVSVLGALLLKIGDLVGVSWTLRSFTFALRAISSLLPTLLLLGVCAKHYAERYGASVMVVSGLLYAAATPVMSYSRLAYGHTLAGAMSMIGVLLILGVRKEQRPDLRALLGGGLCALAVSADYMAAFWGPALAVGLGADAVLRGRWRLLGLSAGGAVLGIAPLFAYHAAAFGSVFSTGYHHSATQAFAEKHAQGLLGLTWPSLETFHRIVTDPGAGLLWWMPLVLVGAYGLWLEQRSSLSTRFEGRLLLSIVVTGLAVNLGLNFEGGWRVGPRYLLTFVPVIVPGLAFVLTRQKGEGIKVMLVGVLAVYSLWVNQAAASLWPHFDLAHVNSPVAEVLRPLIEKTMVPYGWAGAWLGPSAHWLYLLFPTALVAYLYAKMQISGIRVALACLVAMGLGSLAAWHAPSWVQPHQDSAGNLRYVQSVWEPRRSADEGLFISPRSMPLPRMPKN